MARRAGVWLLMLLAAATAVLSGSALERLGGERSAGAQLLYLPNGQYLKLASLGQATLLADLAYIWAIQFYSDYEREDRFRYVQHVFGDVITELDPHYIDAYWLGALILIVEDRDLEGGLALLDAGFERNPDQWVLPYLAGWECSLAGRPAMAAAYFDRAAAVEGAPQSARRIQAAMTSRSGDLETALALWQEIYDDPQSDSSSVAIAERKIRELLVQIDLRDLRSAIERFRIENARYPDSLEQLHRRGYIRLVPRDPDGRDYSYDSRSGTVAAPGAGRVLGEST